MCLHTPLEMDLEAFTSLQPPTPYKYVSIYICDHVLYDYCELLSSCKGCINTINLAYKHIRNINAHFLYIFNNLYCHHTICMYVFYLIFFIQHHPVEYQKFSILNLSQKAEKQFDKTYLVVRMRRYVAVPVERHW